VPGWDKKRGGSEERRKQFYHTYPPLSVLRSARGSGEGLKAGSGRKSLKYRKFRTSEAIIRLKLPSRRGDAAKWPKRTRTQEGMLGRLKKCQKNEACKKKKKKERILLVLRSLKIFKFGEKDNSREKNLDEVSKLTFTRNDANLWRKVT